MDAARPFLEFREVTKAFRGRVVVDGVSLSVPAGHVRALLGENGAGKSTLVKMLTGVHQASSGEIWLDDRRIDNNPPVAAIESGVVAIYQEFSLVPNLTVAENMFLGRLPRRRGFVDRKTLHRLAGETLAILGAELDPGTRVEGLNVAQQQLVEIAKALVRNPKVLVMDEPTAALNDAEIASLFAVVRRLRDRGVCVLYISHRMSEIFALADSVSVLKDGKHVGTLGVDEVDQDKLVRMMIGRDLGSFYPPPRATPGKDVALSVRNLRGGRNLDVAELDVARGEIVGIAGLEGQGQRDLVRVLSGAVRAEGGEVFVDGVPVNISTPAKARAAGIGFVPDDRKGDGLALVRSCAENMALGSLMARTRFGFFVDRAGEKAFVEEMISSLQVRLRTASQPAMDLSGGNQQKLVLAKTLGMRPKILIMGEPTRGVDVGAKYEIYTIMRRLASEGVGILMMSSELPEIIGMSDRVLVMAHGSVVRCLVGNEITEETIMKAATHEVS